jgi:sialate O-acetylesterase
MRRKPFGLLAQILLAGMTVTAADTPSLPFVSPIFGDNMVLQRGKPNAI